MALAKNLKKNKRKLGLWVYLFGGLALLAVLGYFVYINESRKQSFKLPEEDPPTVIMEEEPTTKKESKALISELEKILANEVGVYGYHVIELDDGRGFGARDKTYYRAASTVKVAIFAYLYNQIEAGKISPETQLIYTATDYEEGTGELQKDEIGSKYSVSFLAKEMIVESDNVATNILIRNLGRANIQKFIESKKIEGVSIVTNQVTPKGMAELLKKIYQGKLISDSNSKLLFDYMKNSIIPSRLVAGVPSGVDVAHKIGTWEDAISDIGVVFAENRPYVIAVFTEGVPWTEEKEATIAKISRKVYEFESSF